MFFVVVAHRSSIPGTLGAPQAVVLGAVEGITEFLPISSTGHLLITERLFRLGTTSAAGDAVDAYAIVIQGGAILAVAFVYGRRLLHSGAAVAGTLRLPGFPSDVNPDDRRVAVAVALAAAPAGVIGFLGEDIVRHYLFSPIPVALAWAGGGLGLLGAGRWLARQQLMDADSGSRLGQVSARQGLIIGIAQTLALWPGISRSLVTIVAGCLVGLTLPAAVELSFLVGFVVLVGATGFELAQHGGAIVAAYGWVNPLLGVTVAFVCAVAAIRWLLRIVSSNSLAGFGWYRLAAAALTLVLVTSRLV